jgi:hypothetical protein
VYLSFFHCWGCNISISLLSVCDDLYVFISSQNFAVKLWILLKKVETEKPWTYIRDLSGDFSVWSWYSSGWQNVSFARRMPSSGMLCHVAFVRADISEEHIVSIIRVRIGALRTLQ